MAGGAYTRGSAGLRAPRRSAGARRARPCSTLR
jgi:hypothetical protein